MARNPFLADEYRARAAAEIAAGAQSALEHVRAKHAQAASVWTELAEAADLRTMEREAGRVRRNGV